jgi:hypothetical protein
MIVRECREGHLRSIERPRLGGDHIEPVEQPVARTGDTREETAVPAHLTRRERSTRATGTVNSRDGNGQLA